jgi:hypothetical protein
MIEIKYAEEQLMHPYLFLSVLLSAPKQPKPCKEDPFQESSLDC